MNYTKEARQSRGWSPKRHADVRDVGGRNCRLTRWSKTEIIEMVGTDIAECGNVVKEIDFQGDIESKIIKADTFWDSDSAKRKGKTTDTNEYYSEVVGEFLIENGFIEKNNFTGVHQIPKNEAYSTDKEFSFIASSLTDLYADLSLVEKYGSVIDSVVPIGNCVEDKAGVIDLITYKKERNETNGELFIIKVKPRRSDETLLSAVLEIQTYYQTMDKERLVAQLYSTGKINSDKVKIKKAMILVQDSNPYNEYKENCVNVSKIIKDFDIEIILEE